MKNKIRVNYKRFLLLFSLVFLLTACHSKQVSQSEDRYKSACNTVNQDFKRAFNMDMGKYNPEYLKCSSDVVDGGFESGIVAVFKVDKQNLQNLVKEYNLHPIWIAKNYRTFSFFPNGWRTGSYDLPFFEEINQYDASKVKFIYDTGYFHTKRTLAFYLYWVPISDTQYKALISVES